MSFFWETIKWLDRIGNIPLEREIVYSCVTQEEQEENGSQKYMRSELQLYQEAFSSPCFILDGEFRRLISLQITPKKNFLAIIDRTMYCLFDVTTSWASSQQSNFDRNS
ncbi:hypothetical protein CEXT_376031 [Caerostris extrusa]|uniref:Uncharacterized protein n=1 Tax=Caerostris extrusa TaxID=172846 RepID=A0AAV4XG82_CAEEX|nr:hypothetical protein CEXT_376031 [Caerostris extrusa]